MRHTHATIESMKTRHAYNHRGDKKEPDTMRLSLKSVRCMFANAIETRDTFKFTVIKQHLHKYVVFLTNKTKYYLVINRSMPLERYERTEVIHESRIV